MQREDLESAVMDGLSISQIAVRLARSKGSVRYWLAKYGIRTSHRPRRESTPAARAARVAGDVSLTQDRPKHGQSLHVLERSGYYRCVRCRSEHVTSRRRRLKQLLIEEAGGACILCGYSRSRRALEFHHLDPNGKAFGLGDRGAAVSLATLRDEARKCVLLCSNCHAEVEDGIRVVSVK